MVRYDSARLLATENQALKILCGNTVNSKRLADTEAKSGIEAGIADQHTSICTQQPKRSKSCIHQLRSNALPLSIWQNSNRAQRIPSRILAIYHGQRECNMADHGAGILGNKREDKRVGISQRLNYQMFGLPAKRMVCKCLDIDSPDCCMIGGCFRSDQHFQLPFG